MRKKLIAPSILSADFAHLANEVDAVIDAGADWVHIDVMDGHFVPNITIGAPVVKKLRASTEAFFDVHLMIENPEMFIQEFADAGADLITVHVEAVKDLGACIDMIRSTGCKVGMTMRPKTDLAPYMKFLDQVDLYLVMTVEPGFGGQSFLVDQVEKIKMAREYISQNELTTLIEVDGGVNAETVHHLEDVDVLVAGSYVFKNEYKTAIQSLRNG